METGQPERQWYVLRVKSHCEKAVASAIHNKGFEEFLPLSKYCHRWSDRSKAVEVPLFPGYVFCRLQIERGLALLTIPGALHFVGIGKTPVPVDQSEIAAIQTALRSESAVSPWPYLEIGQRVRLASGPMTGLEGLLVEIRDRQRVVVGLTILKRALAVEIERHWVEPVGRTVSLESISSRRSWKSSGN